MIAPLGHSDDVSRVYSAYAGPSISTHAGGLLKDLERTRVIRCDEAPWQLLGLSFAGWNAVLSLLLSAVSIRAGISARRRS